MNAGPSFFLDGVSLSLLYPSFTFDNLIRCECVRVVSDFIYSCFYSLCVNVCHEIFVYIYA